MILAVPTLQLLQVRVIEGKRRSRGPQTILFSCFTKRSRVAGEKHVDPNLQHTSTLHVRAYVTLCLTFRFMKLEKDSSNVKRRVHYIH